MGVALVLVSHSADAARGSAEIAGQMAPDVTIAPAGGTGGGLGTDLELVLDALRTALAAGDVVVLTDLGSAVLTAESAVEMLDDGDANRVVLADAPFVEGAVAAAVAAQQGEDRDGVVAAAERAGQAFAGAAAAADRPDGAPAEPRPAPAEPAGGGAGSGTVRATVVLRDPHGMHARPAAVLARLAAAQPVQVRVGGVNAASMLELMQLDAREGAELTVEADGEGAQDAVDAVVRAIEDGLGETLPPPQG